MVDCRWANPATASSESNVVPLGRQYALASGFMEINYDSGAKVILQGPTSYQVESASGGFLSLGKLTAGVRRRTATPFLYSYSHRRRHCIGPNAEFGVEVDRSGKSAHVYRGEVEVRPTGGGGVSRAVRLSDNESARVGTGPNQSMSITVTRGTDTTRAPAFARQLYSPAGRAGQPSRDGESLAEAQQLARLVQLERACAEKDQEIRKTRNELRSLASLNGTATDSETVTQKQKQLLDDYAAYHQALARKQFEVADLESQLAAKRASSSDADTPRASSFRLRWT